MLEGGIFGFRWCFACVMLVLRTFYNRVGRKNDTKHERRVFTHFVSNFVPSRMRNWICLGTRLIRCQVVPVKLSNLCWPVSCGQIVGCLHYWVFSIRPWRPAQFVVCRSKRSKSVSSTSITIMEMTASRCWLAWYSEKFKWRRVSVVELKLRILSAAVMCV